MALPTMRPFWMKNCRNATEGMHVKRSQEEADYRHGWDQTAKYFNKYEVVVQKQNDWSTDFPRSQSKERIKTSYLQSRKMEVLATRRTRLAKMLMDEARNYERELKESKFSSRDVFSHMQNRVDELKSEREQRRKQDANRRLYEHWRKNEPSLRKIESDQHMKEVVQSWSNQVAQHEQVRKTALEEDENIRKMTDLQAVKEEEEETWRRVSRREQNSKNAEALRLQIQELKLKEEEAEILRKEQEMLMAEQRLIEESEEKRRQFEEQRKKQEFGRVLVRQHKAQLRRKSKAVQDALELDLMILEELSRKEDVEKARLTARREQAKSDAEFMKKVVTDQLKLEKTREAELDILYQEEAARQWQKREIEWERERVAREKLMKEVLVERQGQITSKLEALREKQRESIIKREELLNDVERYKVEQELEKKEKERMKEMQKQELQAQITSREEKTQAARLQRDLETKRQREEKEEYQSFLGREAQLMTARGVSPRHFPRRRVAFD